MVAVDDGRDINGYAWQLADVNCCPKMVMSAKNNNGSDDMIATISRGGDVH